MGSDSDCYIGRRLLDFAYPADTFRSYKGMGLCRSYDGVDFLLGHQVLDFGLDGISLCLGIAGDFFVLVDESDLGFDCGDFIDAHVVPPVVKNEHKKRQAFLPATLPVVGGC